MKEVNCFIFLARLAGFEPATYGLEGYKGGFNRVKQQATREE